MIRAVDVFGTLWFLNADRLICADVYLMDGVRHVRIAIPLKGINDRTTQEIIFAGDNAHEVIAHLEWKAAQTRKEVSR